MKSITIKDPTIAKEPYKWSDQVKGKLSYEKWVEFIDSKNNYFQWLENTNSGIETLKNIDKIPLDFKDGMIKKLKKGQALAEFNTKKGWHEIVIDFHRDFGIVRTTFMKKITKKHLEVLFEMANHLDGYLLKNGNKIIDQKFIDAY